MSRVHPSQKVVEFCAEGLYYNMSCRHSSAQCTNVGICAGPTFPCFVTDERIWRRVIAVTISFVDVEWRND